MTLKEALKQLKTLGRDKVRKQNARSGAGDNQFGVGLGDIRVLAKQIRTDHELGLSLWETGNMDAQFLAALLVQPGTLSAEAIAGLPCFQGMHLAVRPYLDQRDGAPEELSFWRRFAGAGAPVVDK